MKSPIAPPRITRIRPDGLSTDTPTSCPPSDRGRTLRLTHSVCRECTNQNRRAEDESETGKQPPTFRRPCAPLNLVAQQVGHRYPNQPGHNHQIRQHRDEQPTRFRSQERRIKERLLSLIHISDPTRL